VNAPPQLEWAEANQRFMVAEFVRLKELLGAPKAAEVDDDLEAGQEELPGPAAIDALAQTFGLSRFERDVLLLAAGVEMDAGLAERCGEALGQPQRSWATFGLALAALPDPHWSALAPVAPLRRWRLVEVDESVGLASARLQVDERVLHYLAGINYLDTRLQPLLRTLSPPRLMAEGQQRIAEEIARALETHDGPLPVVQLNGDDPDGQEDVAARAADDLGASLYVISSADLPTNPHESDALATLWSREAALSGTALLIEQAETANGAVVQRFVERTDGLIIVAARDPQHFRKPVLPFQVDRPDAPEQSKMWRTVLGDAAEGLDDALDGVAGQYRLSARRISATAPQIVALLDDDGLRSQISWPTVLRVGASALDSLAQRIEPKVGWEDLILADSQKSALREIASHVRHRLRVHHDWGFAEKGARGLGISAAFFGKSGVGKTMAAEALAGELGLELYRIDLSATVSKYIGETEKNLRRVFDAAEESGAILLFDEADALFGKRSEVKDSHDRYANIEVSYLLQRMEAYRGLAILTTNHRAALDTGFQRRLRFVVQFEFPGQEQRELIWRGIFPEATPLERIDYRKLARLNVAGGHIRNIALNAAFHAAEAGTPLSMTHLLRAAHLEAAKRESPITDAETRGWV
jgi:AAA+ superfamily predicted ATPase